MSKFPADPRLATFAVDGGGLLTQIPEHVAIPRTASDVVDLVNEARHSGTALTIRGGGKTTEGESLAVPGEILVSLRGLNGILEITDNTVWVEGGATFEELESALQHRGLTVMSAPLNLSATIGGTVGVGGIDVNSFRYGCVADQVLELEVVTPSGQCLTCSEACEPDLFERVIYGYGQFGIVTKVRLPVRPHKPVRLEFVYYPSLEGAVRDLKQIWRDGSADMAGVLSLRNDVASLLVGFECDKQDRRFEDLRSTLAGTGELGLLGAKATRVLADPMIVSRLPWLLSSRQQILKGLSNPLYRDDQGLLTNRLAAFGQLIWGFWGHKPIVIPDLAVRLEDLDRAVSEGYKLTADRFDRFTLYIVGVRKRRWRPAYDLGPFPKTEGELVCGVEYEPMLSGRFWTPEIVQEFKHAIYGLGRDLGGRAYRFGGQMKESIEGLCGSDAWQDFVAAKQQSDPGLILNPRVLL